MSKKKSFAEVWEEDLGRSGYPDINSRTIITETREAGIELTSYSFDVATDFENTGVEINSKNFSAYLAITELILDKNEVPNVDNFSKEENNVFEIISNRYTIELVNVISESNIDSDTKNNLYKEILNDTEREIKIVQALEGESIEDKLKDINQENNMKLIEKIPFNFRNDTSTNLLIETVNKIKNTFAIIDITKNLEEIEDQNDLSLER